MCLHTVIFSYPLNPRFEEIQLTCLSGEPLAIVVGIIDKMRVNNLKN